MAHNLSDSDSEFDDMERSVAGEYYDHEEEVVNDVEEVGANDDGYVEPGDDEGEEIDPIVREFGVDNPNISRATSEQGDFFYIARARPVSAESPSEFAKMGKKYVPIAMKVGNYDDAGKLLPNVEEYVHHLELYVPDHMMNDNQGDGQAEVLEAYKDAASDALRLAFATEGDGSTDFQVEEPSVPTKADVTKALTAALNALPTQAEVVQNNSRALADQVFVVTDVNLPSRLTTTMTLSEPVAHSLVRMQEHERCLTR